MTRNVSFDFLAKDKASTTAEKLGRNLDELGRKIDKAGGTVEVDADIRSAEAKIARLEAQDIKVKADISSAERQLAILEAEAKEATGTRRLEIDDNIGQVRARLAQLSATKLLIDADIDQALIKMKALADRRDELERRNNRRLKFDIDVQGAVNKLSRVGQSMRNIRVLASTPVILTLGVAGTGLFDSLKAATPGLFGIGAALLGSAGVAVGALKGIGDAVTALGEKDTSVSSKMQSNARSVASSMRGVELAHRAVRDAQQGVTDARYALTQANRDALNSERDLDDARQQAIDNLRELARREDEMQAARAGAAISVLEAEERLREVQVDPRATDVQRARAAYNLSEARRRVKTLAEDEKQLKAERADAQKKGVEGSDVVQAALLRQEAAQRRVAEAIRAVRKAQQGVADAAWNLRDAQAAVREASQRTGDVGSASMNKVRDAMSGLTPEAQKFARYLRSVLDGPIAEWRATAQRAFLPGLQRGIEGFFANTPNVNASIKTLGENLGRIAERVGPALGRAVDSFARLSARASDKTWKIFADTIVDILDRFSEWADSKSPEDIEKDLKNVGKTIGELRDAAKYTWKIISFGMTVFRLTGRAARHFYDDEIEPLVSLFESVGNKGKWLWREIRDAWNWIKRKGTDVKNWLTNKVFRPVEKDTDRLGTSFRTMKVNIGAAWDAIRDKAKKPVRFVVNTVMGGLATQFNLLSKKIGGPTLKVPHVNFDSGGVMPGYTPGQDVHKFFSPTAGTLALSGGEAVMRPEFTKAAGGRKGIDRLNLLARRGQLEELLGGVRGFAGGGVLDWIKGKSASAFDWVSDKASKLYKIATDPRAALSGFGAVPGTGIVSDLGRSVVKSITNAAVNKLTGLWKSFKGAFDDFLPAGSGGSGMGWQAQSAWVRKNLPGVAITSGYRPGSITVSGNTSYHARGRAVDLAPSMATFNAIRSAFGSSIAELIYSPAGSRQLKNGKPYFYGGGVRAQHWNHVHWAMRNGGIFDNGGMLKPGMNAVYNGTGRPEPVLTSSQWDDVRRVASVGRSINGDTIMIDVTVPNSVIGNDQQIAKTVTTAVQYAVNNGTIRFRGSKR